MATKTKISKETARHLASLSAWDIAKHFNCEFHGDSNPIQHGGIFYDLRDWVNYGYANTISFWKDLENGTLVVQKGTINKVNDKDLESCWETIDIDADDPIRLIPQQQVYAAWCYAGVEPEGIEYPYSKRFNLDIWPEENIWRNICDWLQELGN